MLILSLLLILVASSASAADSSGKPAGKASCDLVSISGATYEPLGDAGFEVECSKEDAGKPIKITWNCEGKIVTSESVCESSCGDGQLQIYEKCEEGIADCPGDEICDHCQCLNTCDQLGYAENPLKNECGNKFTLEGTAAKDAGAPANEGDTCAAEPGKTEFDTTGTCYWKSSPEGGAGGKKGSCIKDLNAGMGECKEVQVTLPEAKTQCPVLNCTREGLPEITAACDIKKCGACPDDKRKQCSFNPKKPDEENAECLARDSKNAWENHKCKSDCLCAACACAKTPCTTGMYCDPATCECMPFCGNGTVDLTEGEQCETNSDCSSGETCNKKCLCEGEKKVTVNVAIQVTTTTSGGAGEGGGDAGGGTFTVKAETSSSSEGGAPT